MLAFEHKRLTSRARATAQPVQQRQLLPRSANPVIQRAPSCACGGSCPRCQAKSALKIGAPDDAYEREADTVADRVMRMADGADPITPAASDLQRECAGCSAEQIHLDSAAQQSARDVKAHAYTVGQHIVSGTGRFAPRTSEGRRLIVRDLTYVVERSEAEEIRAGHGKEKRDLSPISHAFTEPRFDHDFSQVRAYRQAKRILRRQTVGSSPTEAPTAAADYEFDRSHFCLDAPNPSNPTRHPFTQRERHRASFGLWNARSIATGAFVNLGHRDPYHLRMAERAFGSSVTFDVLDQHTRRVRRVLSNLSIDQNLLAATCDDPECNTGSKNAVAVTLDDLSAVILCPFYFIQPARTLVTTLLHEAGHMAGIDVNWAPGNERYCRDDDVIECDNICPLSGENLLENVDAWARFLYCLSNSG